MVREAELEIHAKGASSKAQLRRSPMRVGRADDADIVIDDPSVSRLHFRVEWRDDGWWVVDEGNNKNGTSVNGRRQAAARVRHGDTIGAGSASLVLNDPRDAAPPPAKKPLAVTMRPTPVQELMRPAAEEVVYSKLPIAVVEATESPSPPAKKAEASSSVARVVIVLLCLVIVGVMIAKALPRGDAASQDVKSNFLDDTWAEVTVECEGEECLRLGRQAVETARRRVEHAALAGENLFMAVREAKRGVLAFQKAGAAAPAGALAEAVALRDEAGGKLQKTTEELEFRVKRAIQVRDYREASTHVAKMLSLFPDTRSKGYKRATELRRTAEVCRSTKGSARGC